MRKYTETAKKFQKYNIYFEELKIPQLKDLIDLTLGMDMETLNLINGIANFSLQRITTSGRVTRKVENRL